MAQQVAELIRSGEIATGNRLPSERDLAKRLGVSRPIVREAMIALEIADLVEIRTGSGVYVKPATTMADLPARPEVLLRFDAGPGPFELLSARLLIEPVIAAEAARLASRQEMTEMERTIEELVKSPDHRASLEADREFHILIATASRNSVLVSIVEELWAGMLGPLYETVALRTGLTATLDMTVQDHRAIVAGITSRSSAAARKAMQRHLEHVREILASFDEESQDS
ncbi:MAG: FadR/GntR family transcriptional regulator [Parvibaculaceae bacterium]